MLLNSYSRRSVGSGILVLLFICVTVTIVAAQKQKKVSTTAAPQVTKIDIDGLKTVLKPNGRPLVVNFWATWCDPCREEFPDLVKFNAANKDKIDLRTVSIDDLAEIDRDVPKFLSLMKADMPAYLLKVPDESEAIKLVSPDWAGNLPLTIVIDTDGKVVYQKNSKVRIDILQSEVNKLTSK